MIFKRVTERERKDFINYLQELIDSYNNSYHTTIKNKPSVVFNTNSDKVIEETKINIQNLADKMIHVETKDEKLKRGDYVRISNATKSSVKKDIFQKKYVQNYSNDIYKIIGVGRKNKNYGLEDVKTGVKLDKRYYSDQLLKIDYDGYDKAEELKKTRKEGWEVYGRKIVLKYNDV